MPEPAPHAAAPAPMSIPQGVPAVAVAAPTEAQARSDAPLLELWLFGKSPRTRRDGTHLAKATLGQVDRHGGR